MGSSGSSSSGMDDNEHGEWKDGNSSCNCSSEYKTINYLKWIECDTMNRNAKHLINVGRAATLGVAEYWAQFNDITHDAIECSVTCYNCHEPDQTFTFDYCAMGKRYRNGKYHKQYAPKRILYQRDIQNDEALSLYCLERVYLATKPRRQNYHLLKNNCKHFARRFWRQYHKLGHQDQCSTSSDTD